jgi:hypothetical protein
MGKVVPIRTDRGYGELPPDPPTKFLTRYDEMYDAWKIFHKNNPKVYIVLCALIEEWWKAGQRKLGMSLLFGVLRWRMTIITKDPGGFKLNNNHMRFYVDLYEKHHQHRPGLFVKRKQPSKEKLPTNKEPLGPKDFPSE